MTMRSRKYFRYLIVTDGNRVNILEIKDLLEQSHLGYILIRGGCKKKCNVETDLQELLLPGV